MPFHLRRVRDGAGDSGPSSESISWNDNGSFKEFQGHIPKIGNSMRVGALSARSYSNQDWWMTTPITEIIEEINNDQVHYIKFKTGNSIYEWWNGVYPKKDEK